MNLKIRKVVLIGCLPICSLMLAGCGDTGILIVRDQYWRTLEFDAETEAQIQLAVEKSGRSLRYADISYPIGTDEISALISAEDPQVAILSPLLSQHAVEIANLQSPRRIVAFSPVTGRETVDNLTRLVSSRREAFEQIGLLCRQYLQYAGNLDKSVGGVFYSGGNQRTSERFAFLEGLGDDLADRVAFRSFPQQNSMAEVNDFLSTTENRSIGVYVVSMAGLNRDVIASILSRSRAFVIVEWMGYHSGTFPYDERVVGVMKEEWIAFFAFDLSRLGPEIVVKAVLVPGPAADSPRAEWVGAFFNTITKE